MQPLGPRKAWRAITLATLLLVPAFWLLLAGLVSAAEETEGGVANPGAAIAGGLSIIPFVFIALALLSEHPNVPRAVLRALLDLPAVHARLLDDLARGVDRRPGAERDGDGDRREIGRAHV